MKDELDQLLDSALGTYSKKEPWPGIEERVLRRVHRKERRWLKWVAIGVPALAAASLAIVMMRPGPESSVVRETLPPTPVVEKVEPMVAAAPSLRRPRAPRAPAP